MTQTPVPAPRHAPAIGQPIRVVVLGGGFGGLETCKALDDQRFQVTLIDRQNHHLFQPLLYQVATGGLSAPEIAQPLRAVLTEQKNVTVLMGEVKAIDLPARLVQLPNQQLGYDYLIIALGARTGYFGHHEWEQFAPGLKTLDDATKLRHDVLLAYEKAEASTDPAEVKALLTSVVVGGGPTGVEMAGSLAELAHQVLKSDFRRINPTSARILLVEGSPRILGTFAESQSQYAEKRLKKMGVEVRTKTVVSEVGEGYLICNGERIDAANMIWAAGVEASPLTKTLGVPVDRGGRIEVAPDCSLPGHPEVFAIGDLASLVDKNGVKVPGVSPAAMQMGRHAAKVIIEELRRKEMGRPLSENIPRPAFAYWDKGSMATIGRSAAVAAVGNFKFNGFIAWLAWLFVHLVFLVGLRNKFAVFGQWAYAYMTFKRSARIIMGVSTKETP